MPRAFNKMTPMNVCWRSNKRAWMTADLFLQYIQRFNSSMKLKGRRVLLLLDNAPVHAEIDLENTKLLFLPPNTTAGTQPLDAGIIKNFKSTALVADEICKSVTLRHAVNWISDAWKEVATSTICNCFRHVGIGEISIGSEQVREDCDEEEIVQAAVALGIEDITIEEDAPAFDEDIQDLETSTLFNDGDDDSFECEDNDEVLPPKPTFRDLFAAQVVIQNFLLHVPIAKAQKSFDSLQNAFIDYRSKTMVNGSLDGYLERNESN
ncbi:hypothetical protein LEN26_020613 [Aphanomyces euteiches]|nr:hypothetical protein LEN26_020613 [Aphanomyces euteiches]